MMDRFIFSARRLAALQDSYTQRWHQEAGLPVAEEESWLETVLAQHAANFELWHTEDRARTPHATEAEIADVKRAIDRINQRRNDLAEQCDVLLLAALEPLHLPAPGVPLHSESPGLMIDRLSILALKIFHTEEQTRRADAPAGHVESNRRRLAILSEQRSDLVECLDRLWREVLNSERRFKIYRQLKMYNDPDLNPAIYLSQRQTL
jgi:Protein of unknown function (DUF4254)